MTTVAPESEVEAVNVSLAIGNEILGRGIEAVLGSLAAVATVRRCARPEELGALLHTAGSPSGTDTDVVIVSALEPEWLAKLNGLTSDRDPRILLLIDESVLNNLRSYTSMPVDGFLSLQDLGASTLSDALIRCRLGDVPMPPALAHALLARADAPAPRGGTRVAKLTSREIEALTLLVRGMSNKQIARRLQISSHGAKRLVASIMLKLDSPNRTTAAVNAIKGGIVDYDGTVIASYNAEPEANASNANDADIVNRYSGPHLRTNGYASRPPEMADR